MAKLISIEMTGDFIVYINPDRIQYIKQLKSEPEKCIVHFTIEQSLTIPLSAMDLSKMMSRP